MSSRRPERILLWSTIVICFVAAELYLRFFEPQKTETQIYRDSPAMYLDSDLIDYELSPGFQGRHRKSEFDVAVSINSLHHRQAEFDVATGDWTMGIKDNRVKVSVKGSTDHKIWRGLIEEINI